MAAVLIRPNASEKSRLRLLVVQALVLSLFLTLFDRLWYMQVATGDGYRAALAAKRVRTMGADAYLEFHRERNSKSIDGLPAVETSPTGRDTPT